MGFNKIQWEFMNRCFRETGLISKNIKLPSCGTLLVKENYYNKEMLELGCQKIKKSMKKELRSCSVAREYFKSIGIKCVSVDLTGCLSSKKIDLRQPIKKKYHGKFDIVTNSGTTEHIVPLRRQYNVFKNIHDCTKIGGVIIHILPSIGEYLDHCQIYYGHKFYRELARTNNYKIIFIDTLRKDKTGFIIKGVCFIKMEGKDFFIKKRDFFKHIKHIRKNRKNRYS